ILRAGEPMAQLGLRWTAPGSGEPNDMQLYLFTWPESQTIRLSAVLQRPRARGCLRLNSLDPRIQPAISLNYAADPEDLRRLVAGARPIVQVAQSRQLAACITGTVTLDDGATVTMAECRRLMASETA